MVKAGLNAVHHNMDNSYSVMNLQELEKTPIPIDFNTQSFYSKEIQRKYIKEVYLKSYSESKLSPVYKHNLKIFFIFLSLCSIVQVSFAAVAYSKESMTDDWISIQVTGNVLAEVFTIILIGINRYQAAFIVEYSFQWTIVCICYNIFLIITDYRVYCGINNEDCIEDYPSTTILAVIMLLLHKKISFSIYLNNFITSIVTLFVYLIFNFVFNPIKTYKLAYETFMLIIVVVMNITSSQQEDIRSRYIFWSTKQQSLDLQQVKEDFMQHSPKSSSLRTDDPSAICNKVLDNLRQLNTSVLLNENKLQIEESVRYLKIIKSQLQSKKLVSGGNTAVENEVDNEQIEFINQHFMNPTEKPKRVRLENQSTMNAAAFLKQVNSKASEFLPEIQTLGYNWNVDILKIYHQTGHSITIAGKFVFSKWDLNDTLRVDQQTVDSFLVKMEQNYFQNPYHNGSHAVDVMNSLLYFVMQSSLQNFITAMDLQICIVSALAHDLNHPGFNNRYIINSKHDIAITYNDKSVLESMHVSTLYRLMQDESVNIYQNLSDEEWQYSRQLIIRMVLATDMAKHFKLLQDFKNRNMIVSEWENEAQLEDKRHVAMTFGIKCADLGHSAKAIKIHTKWSELVQLEFFIQGDNERQQNLPISMLCDRNNTDIPKSQHGFLKNICYPLFQIWIKFLSEKRIEQDCIQQMETNMEVWEARVGNYEFNPNHIA